MKRLLVVLLCCTILLPVSSFAGIDIGKLLELANDIYGVNLDVKNLDQESLLQLKDMRNGLIGTHDFGNRYYDENELSWGSNAERWEDLLRLAEANGGSGEVGRVIAELAGQFPIRQQLGSSDIENEYYLLQAQQTLAARASSQVAFNQVNHEDKTINDLHQLIDATKDNKSATDLNNRLSAEQTKVSIQQTKLLAILVQQVALESQEKANRMQESADFFDVR